MPLVSPSQILVCLKHQNPGDATVGRVLGWTDPCAGESLAPSTSPSPFSQPHSHPSPPLPALPSTMCLSWFPPCPFRVLYMSQISGAQVTLTKELLVLLYPPALPGAPRAPPAAGKAGAPCQPPALDRTRADGPTAGPRWHHRAPGAGSSSVESNRTNLRAERWDLSMEHWDQLVVPNTLGNAVGIYV